MIVGMNFVSVPAFTVAGFALRASNGSPEPIAAHWRAFYAGGGTAHIVPRLDDDIYAVYMDYEGDETQLYTLILGCRVAEDAPLAPGLVMRRIAAARYAVLDGSGPQPESVIATWRSVGAGALPRAYSADFDRYDAARPGRVAVHVALSNQR